MVMGNGSNDLEQRKKEGKEAQWNDSSLPKYHLGPLGALQSKLTTENSSSVPKLWYPSHFPVQSHTPGEV